MGTIRLLLALGVVISHSASLFGLLLLPGDVSVTAFFMVSGFLMALILETRYVGRVRAFYLNRVLRIYPPYLVALAGSVLFFFLVSNRFHDPSRALIWFVEEDARGALAWSALTNLTLIGINLTRYVNLDESGHFFINFLEAGAGFPGHNILFVPQAWTLSIELYYYALAPFDVLLRTRYIAAITLALFIATTEATLYLDRQNIPFDAASAFAFQLKYFLLGALAFRGVGPLQRLMSRWPLLRPSLPAASFIAALVIVFTGWRAFNALGFELDLLFLAIAACLPGAFILTNRWKIDAALGEYSYPVYLFHYPVTISVYLWLPLQWHGELTAAITLLLATIYIRLIDRRIEAVRRGIAGDRPRSQPPSPAAEPLENLPAAQPPIPEASRLERDLNAPPG